MPRSLRPPPLVILTALAFAAATASAAFDVPLIHCQPESVATQVRIKTAYWKGAIEARWCQGKRTARYVLVVSCSEGAKDNAHLTTFNFVGPGVVDKAKVDIDPSAPDVLDRGLPHGLVHAIVPACLPATLPLLDLPHWIMEGMAQSFVVGLEEDARTLFSKGDGEALKPLEQLLFEQSRELAFRTQAALLVNFLVDNYGGPENFKRFVVELGFEKAPPALSLPHLAQYGRVLKARFGVTIAELDAAFRQHVRKLVTPAPR